MRAKHHLPLMACLCRRTTFLHEISFSLHSLLDGHSCTSFYNFFPMPVIFARVDRFIQLPPLIGQADISSQFHHNWKTRKYEKGREKKKAIESDRKFFVLHIYRIAATSLLPDLGIGLVNTSFVARQVFSHGCPKAGKCSSGIVSSSFPFSKFC